MIDVLDVQILAPGSDSRTRSLRNAFFAGLGSSLPSARVVTLDLASDYDLLPVVDSWDITAKFEMAYGEGLLDEEQAKRWDRITRLTDQLHAARVIAISAPMWNFSVPWPLKRWLDSVMQTRLTFDVTAQGNAGLLNGRAGVILSTRHGRYGPGDPLEGLDFHIPYLRAVLGFMGVAPVDVVVAEGLLDPSGAANRMARGIDEARRLGERIGGELAPR